MNDSKTKTSNPNCFFLKKNTSYPFLNLMVDVTSIDSPPFSIVSTSTEFFLKKTGDDDVIVALYFLLSILNGHFLVILVFSNLLLSDKIFEFVVGLPVSQDKILLNNG